MLDPFSIPHLTPKAPRVCSNPLCGKTLSKLNKQDACFSCFNRATLTRTALPSYRASASRSLRTTPQPPNAG